MFAIGLAACSSSSDNGSAGTTDPMPTQEEQQLAALQQEIADLRAQLGISDDADIGDSITALMAERDRLQKQIDDAADEAERKAAEAAAAAMAVTAAKLYAGIGAPGGTGDATRSAAYDADGNVEVTIGTAAAVDLSEDEDAMVSANAGWAGKRYTRTMPATDGMYEAVVYSNVEAPTMGKKFVGAAADDEFEYALTNGRFITVDTSTAGVPARVALSGVTRTAGTETFNLPDPNPQGLTAIPVPGSFHGVSGTYSCTPTTPADGCSASVAAMGFTLRAELGRSRQATRTPGSWSRQTPFMPRMAGGSTKPQTTATSPQAHSFGRW